MCPPPEHKTPPHYLVSIFEASNETLKEVLLGATPRLLQQLVREHEERRPTEISHWAEEHRVGYRCLEYSISGREARAFISKRARVLRDKGWKVLQESD